ncbi:type II toxin-antitoxin system mRNA interferase toxin, RelE/StbE family [Lactiplantibacillus garii]|uniref:Type II toxin-antitoxin system mRNA interferase toxin, RelE/StbE family n=1 Tax=Lactiplantibacillus garii TaxID=2306423 RepID=A0A3R8L156_9LACO|nr:type II toxin-antitoxin system mRNA interferase toxin, RelE/StbE family [Lactiplantibacillus garii]
MAVILDENEDLLKTKYKLHALSGDKSGLYDIHLESNWLLIYEITDNTLFLTLTLSATGTHQATLGK